MLEKKYKVKVQKKGVKEPSAPYAMGSLRFFYSFEEMEEADSIEAPKFTSLEHLQHITKFIKHAYCEELKYKMQDLKIFYK